MDCIISEPYSRSTGRNILPLMHQTPYSPPSILYDIVVPCSRTFSICSNSMTVITKISTFSPQSR